MGIQCFMLEPTERVRQKLRRYVGSDKAHCPDMPGTLSYHDAATLIEDAAATWDAEHRCIRNGVDSAAAYDDDPRWPTHCACGYAFTDDDPRQLFVDLIYRRTDTGEEVTLPDTPGGAMWYCDWMGPLWNPQLGRLLSVRLPDGTDWLPDTQAQNCTMPDDHDQERHHCWVMHGQPPNLTIDKRGATCAAGAGSIQSRAYHGFLTDGMLT